MKALSSSLITVLFFAISQVLGQDALQSEWRIMPGIVFVNYFPSAPVRISSPPSTDEYNFEGVGFQFIARAFHPNYPDLAFNFSGGINWFGNAHRLPDYGIMPSTRTDGVGATLKRKSFRTFPLMVGLEWIYPRSAERTVMFYAGGNAGFHFVDGDLGLDQQTKFGYTLGAGFVVKVFEFGVRYYSFSDLRNIGAHLGVRLNSFPLQ